MRTFHESPVFTVLHSSYGTSCCFSEALVEFGNYGQVLLHNLYNQVNMKETNILALVLSD